MENQTEEESQEFEADYKEYYAEWKAQRSVASKTSHEQMEDTCLSLDKVLSHGHSMHHPDCPFFSEPIEEDR